MEANDELKKKKDEGGVLKCHNRVRVIVNYNVY